MPATTEKVNERSEIEYKYTVLYCIVSFAIVVQYYKTLLQDFIVGRFMEE